MVTFTIVKGKTNQLKINKNYNIKMKKMFFLGEKDLVVFICIAFYNEPYVTMLKINNNIHVKSKNPTPVTYKVILINPK